MQQHVAEHVESEGNIEVHGVVSWLILHDFVKIEYIKEYRLFSSAGKHSTWLILEAK